MVTCQQVEGIGNVPDLQPIANEGCLFGKVGLQLFINIQFLNALQNAYYIPVTHTGLNLNYFMDELKKIAFMTVI